jgi:hypothetical protein
MLRLFAIAVLGSFATLFSVLPMHARPQDPAANQPANSPAPAPSTLRICLRLEDQSSFLGAASVLMLPESGYELLGVRDDKGEVDFYAVPPGTYTIYVVAAPFSPVRLRVQMEPDREKTLVVVMKRPGAASQELKPQPPPEQPQKEPSEPEPIAAVAKPPEQTQQNDGAEPLQPLTEDTILDTKMQMVMPVSAAAPAPTPKPEKEPWKPVPWSDDNSVLQSGVSCPTDQLLQITGRHVREFVTSMERFTAMETVEHFPVDKNGERKTPERRKFAYVVSIKQDPYNGTFGLEEYRNGGIDRSQFPANIATMGLPALVLVFHPDYAGDFRFNCDGLVRAHNHDYWQLRFAQREDRPVRIESYVVNGSSYPIYLQGRVWVDPGNGQIVRLESQLLKPIPQIELWQQHQVIDYTGINFVSTGQQVWLPQAAEVYVERHNKRYVRRHSFQDFRLFNVDTAQNTKAPTKGSYSFTNLTDSDMSGELTVNPVDGLKGGPVVLRFDVPAHRTVIKTVGPGKDVNIPVGSVASAKFVHSGDSGSVKVDVDLVKETSLDVIPQSALTLNP